MARKLSFAGVSLPLITPKLEEAWLAKVHPRDVFRDWEGWNFDSPNSVSDPLPTPPIPVAPAFKFGVLQWPVGASRPAWFHAVVNTDILDAIRSAVGDPMTPQDLVLFDDRTGKTVTASMYLLPSRPLNQLGHTKSDGWMLTLTDQRFYWHWRRGVITDPSEGTWENLYAQLGSILGVSISADTVSSAYATPSKKWASYYGPTPAVLDAVAATVGQRVVVALDGSVSTTNAGTAATASDAYIAASDPVISGGYLSPQDIRRYVPGAVKTLFLDASVDPHPAAPHVVTNTLASLSITNYSSSQGLSGFYQTVNGDLPYTGTNSAAVAAYASAAATDWYNWRLSDVDLVWPGIEPYPMTGWEDTVEWTFQKRADAPFASTYVRRGPFNDMTSGDWRAGEETEPPVPPDTGCGQGCGWFAGFATSNCLGARVVGAWGACSGITGAQIYDEFNLRYLTGQGKWVSQVWSSVASAFVDQDFIYGFGAGPIRVWMDTTAGDQPNITASIDDLDLVRNCCGNFTANFSGGNNAIGPFCTGTPATGCLPNHFTVEVFCDCCRIPGYTTPGFYCIVSANQDCETGDKVCVELTDEDSCNTNILICSGPYATQEECEGACGGGGGVPSDCCSAGDLPAVLTLTIVGSACAGDYTLTYNGLFWAQFSGTLGGCSPVDYTFECIGGAFWRLKIDKGGSSYTGTVAAPTTCSPLSVSFDPSTGVWAGCCGSTPSSLTVHE